MTFIYGLIQLIGYAAQIYQYMMIGYVILSYLPSARYSVAGEFLAKCVEPFFAPFRKIIPPIGGMIDISPIIAFFAFQFAVSGLIKILIYLFL